MIKSNTFYYHINHLPMKWLVYGFSVYQSRQKHICL